MIDAGGGGGDWRHPECGPKASSTGDPHRCFDVAVLETESRLCRIVEDAAAVDHARQVFGAVVGIMRCGEEQMSLANSNGFSIVGFQFPGAAQGGVGVPVLGRVPDGIQRGRVKFVIKSFAPVA